MKAPSPSQEAVEARKRAENEVPLTLTVTEAADLEHIIQSAIDKSRAALQEELNAEIHDKHRGWNYARELERQLAESRAAQPPEWSVERLDELLDLKFERGPVELSVSDYFKRLEALATMINSSQDKSRAELEREMVTWRSLAQEMTPGGSEFMEPEAVRAYYRKFKDDAHEARKLVAKSRAAPASAELRRGEQPQEWFADGCFIYASDPGGYIVGKAEEPSDAKAIVAAHNAHEKRNIS